VLENVIVSAQSDRKLRIATSERKIVHVDLLPGRGKGESQELEGHLETGNALPVWTEQLDGLTQSPSKFAVASHESVAIAVFKEEKNVATESEVHPLKLRFGAFR
jgi:hypothetical protein